MIVIFISLYLNQKGISINTIGILIAIFGLGGVCGGYLGGHMSDYYSPMKIARISALVNCLTIIIFAYFGNMYILALLLFIMGFSNNSFRPATLLLITSFAVHQKPSTITAYRRVAINLGGAIGAILTGVIYHFDPRLIFLVSGVIVLSAFLVLAFIRIEYHISHNKGAVEKNIMASSTAFAKLYFIAILFLLALLVYNQQQTTYGIYLKDHLNISSAYFASLFTINGILVVFLQIPMSKYLERYSASANCAVGSLCIGLGFAAIYFNYGYISALASCLLWSIGEIILFPCALDLMLEVEGASRGKKMGLYQTVFSVAGLGAPLLGTFVYSINNKLLWLTCGFLGIIGLIGFSIVNKIFTNQSRRLT